MRTYLVTGAGGFVGFRLAQALLGGGSRVVALTRDDPPPAGCHVIRGSVDDLSVVRRAVAAYELDGVFHLAAHAKVEECRRDPLGCYDSNVRGTYTLLETLARGKPVPTVVATTDHVYGERRERDLPATEDDPFYGGGSAYDISKAAADIIAQGYNARIVRCGNIYGPGDRDLSRVVPSMISDVLAHRPINIRSDGTPVREYLHISDAVEAYAAVMDHGADGRAYNFAGAIPLSVEALAEMVYQAAELMNIETVRPAIVRGTRTGDISVIRLNYSRARDELGWRPQMGLVSGLQDTIRWWKLPL